MDAIKRLGTELVRRAKSAGARLLQAVKNNDLARSVDGHAGNDMSANSDQHLAASCETICNALMRRPPAGALLLFGEWGSGKTRFFKTRIRAALEARKQKPVYVSVAGLKTTRQLSDALLAAVYPLISTAPVEIGSVVIRSLLRTVKVKSSDINWQADVTASTVFCFDDIERFSGKPETLVGFVQGWVEGRHVPCLLIGDESKLHERENKDGIPYRQIREKIVAASIEFNPSLPQAVDEIVKATANLAELSALKEYQDEIVACLERHAEQNIRSVVFLIETLRPILRAAREVELSDHVVRTIVSMVTAAVLETRRDHKDSHLIFKFISNQHDWITVAYIQNDESHPVGRFVRKVSPSHTSRWPSIPEIGKYLATGALMYAAIRDELEGLKNAYSESAVRRLISGSSHRTGNEDSFRRDQREYLDSLANAEAASLDELVVGISLLGGLAAEGAAIVGMNEVINAHSKALDRHIGARTLDIEGFERAFREIELQHIASLGPAAHNFVDRVRSAKDAVSQSVVVAERLRITSTLLSDFPAFIAEAREGKSGWLDRSMFEEADAVKIAQCILCLAPSQLAEFHEFISNRARSGTHSDERQFFREIIPRLAADTDYSRLLRRYWLRRLIAIFERLAVPAAAAENSGHPHSGIF